MPSRVASAGTAPRRSRAEWHALFATVYPRMSSAEIARVHGVSSSFVRDVIADPTGAKSKARKDRHRGRCESCGAPTTGSAGRANAPRFCRHCAPRELAKWDAEKCVQAIRDYVALFGEPPAASDFTPALARRHCSPERLARAKARKAAGDWPDAATVQYHCGSWNAALVAAGCPPRLGLRRVMAELP